SSPPDVGGPPTFNPPQYDLIAQAVADYPGGPFVFGTTTLTQSLREPGLGRRIRLRREHGLDRRLELGLRERRGSKDKRPAGIVGDRLRDQVVLGRVERWRPADVGRGARIGNGGNREELLNGSDEGADARGDIPRRRRNGRGGGGIAGFSERRQPGRVVVEERRPLCRRDRLEGGDRR